jgi:hypothetical protein
MITCPHCGRESEDAVTECPQCGTALARLSARPLPADSDRTVLLKAFPTEIEAQAAGQALLAAGVPYLIAADNCGGAFPGLEIYRGIQVRVQLRDLERARDILADFEAEKPEVDAETAEQSGATPSAPAVTGSAPTAGSASQKARLSFLAGLGIGIAIAIAVLIDSRTDSRSSYTGVSEFDTDGDGKTDHWIHYRGGQPERDEMDDNFDGKPDAWFFLENNEVVRYETDSNFDGKIDVWTRYAEGRPDTTQADTDFNGKPDVTYHHSAGLTVSGD